MIELIPCECDDLAFLQFVERIANGALGALQMREVYLVQDARPIRPDAYAWYVSFSKEEHWKIDDERGITRRELVSFDERGRKWNRFQVSADPCRDDGDDSFQWKGGSYFGSIELLRHAPPDRTWDLPSLRPAGRSGFHRT